MDPKGEGSLKLASPDWPRSPWTPGDQEVGGQVGYNPSPQPLGLKNNQEAREEGFVQTSQEQTGGSPTLTPSGELPLWTPQPEVPTKNKEHSTWFKDRADQVGTNRVRVQRSRAAPRDTRQVKQKTTRALEQSRADAY